MAQQEFDVVIIGGGPGGYVAAIKAAQLGQKVACIEKRGSLGGTCLNVGCIPSKALLQSSHKYHEALHHFADHGIEVSKVSMSVKKMMERKGSVIAALDKGIESLLAKNKITYFKATGSFKSANEINVESADGKSEVIKAKNIIIATGSEVSTLPSIDIDEKKIVSSTGALELTEVPKKMLVIGGGYIGLEMGSVWMRLGAEVEVVEFMDRLVPAMDLDVSKEFQKVLSKQGMKFTFNTKVTSAKIAGGSVEVTTEAAAGGNATKNKYDVVLVAVGRRAYTNGLNLDVLGVKADKHGKISVDSSYRVISGGASNIYAIGDVIAGPMLAHKAEEEGVAVAEIIAGQHGHVNYEAIPGVVYTAPEVASVGATEQELKEKGIEYKASKFPFMANSRARAIGETEGFVKLLSCKKTDRILGCHIIGSHAGDLITEVVVGMEFKAAAEDLARSCHPHPSLGEAVKEAALGSFAKPIHM